MQKVVKSSRALRSCSNPNHRALRQCARIITNSSFDTQSRPLIAELGWKTIEELTGNESKTMVYKSLNDLAPRYLCNLFTKNSACSSRSLRNTETDLRLPKERLANGQKCFSFRGANYGIASLLSLRKHSPWVASKINTGLNIFFYIVKYHMIVDSYL